MKAELQETTSVLPTPAVAGWTEETRLAEAERVRRQIQSAGGVIIQERRIHNKAFDKRRERTTFEWKVRWIA